MNDPDNYVPRFIAWKKGEIGVPEAFYKKMRGEDDWTTVIKLHSMIEAGLNRLITKQIGDDRLSDIIAELDTGDKQRGKLAFVKALDLLNGDIANFIRQLSRLRNRLVHDVRQFDFHFANWISGLPKEQKQNLRKYTKALLGEAITFDGKTWDVGDAVLQAPKYVLTVAVFGLMAMIFDNEQPAKQSAAPDQSTPKG